MQSIYLRLSINDGCNLRCSYCRPARDVKLSGHRPALSSPDLVKLVGWIDAEVTIRKLRLTGGEPLLRPDATELVASLRRALPDAELCLTTNGTQLSRLAPGLRAAGLDRVNVSLDTTDPQAYRDLTRGGRLETVLSGLAAAREAGFEQIKLNAVLLRSLNGPRLLQLVRDARDLATELRFIELMPISVAAGMHRNEFLSAEEAAAELEAGFGALRPEPGAGIARRFRLAVDGRELVVGFIPSVSDPFCSQCDRLRIDCRGKLYACLRHPDWLDLAKPLAQDEPAVVHERIRRVLAAKCAPEAIWPGRQMSAIGG